MYEFTCYIFAAKVTFSRVIKLNNHPISCFFVRKAGLYQQIIVFLQQLIHSKMTNYRLLHISITLLLCVNFFTGSHAETQLTGRIITTKDGLPSNLINDLIQDDRGYIWLGTANGLCRYDGYSFVNYQTVGCGEGKTNGYVGTFHLDSQNGLLWMRTATFNYACYDLRQQRFVDYTGNCNPQKTFERFWAEDNGIWLYETMAGVRHVTYENGQFHCEDYTQENGSLPPGKVNRVKSDPKGIIWIMTDNGLIRYEKGKGLETVVKGGRFLTCCFYDGKSFFLTKDNEILTFDQKGTLVRRTTIPAILGDIQTVNVSIVWQGKWVFMSRTATITMDLSNYTFEKPEALQMDYGILLDETNGHSWISDSNGTLWLFPKEGDVRKFKLLKDKGFVVTRKRNFSTVQGKDGLFYIATYGNGLFTYDPTADKLEHYAANDKRPIIATNYLINIHMDKDGNIWVGHEDAGIACLHQSALPQTSIILPEPDMRGEKTNYITKLTPQSDGSLLVSTRSHRAYSYHPTTGSISPMGTEPFDNIRIDSIKDDMGRTWIATWEQGLLVTYSDKNGQRTQQQFLTRSTSESRVNTLTIDDQKRLWIATYNGIYMTDTRQKAFTDKSFIHYGTAEGLPGNEINCLLATSDGSLWLGGPGTGVVRCRYDKDHQLSITSVTTRQGLAINNVHSLTEDQQGFIWAGTEDYVSQIHPQSLEVVNHHLGSNFLNGLYSKHCALTLNDGRLVFGTHDGLTIITPSAMTVDDKPHNKATVTNLFVNGKSIFYDDRHQSLRHLQENISLPYSENSLTIHFSNFDYAEQGQAMYEFYLEGIDREWREPTTQHSADYSNLQPGRYVFHLRNSEDLEDTILSITIRQPWYNTWWAWTIYLIVFGSIGWVFYRHKREQFRLQQQMRVEKQVSEFRTNFFTQVAHEFRTPLAIISGAVDQISEGTSSRKPIQTAQRGVRRLTQLVNQLMEFRKINTGNLRLQVESGDIVSLIRDIYQDFWNAAQQKEQSITFTPFAKSYDTVFDRHIIDTIVYNLISNAVKYTPQGGTILIKLNVEQGNILLTVEDSGTGIEAAREQQLFQPFMHGYASQGGMGIGLYTAYKMALAHHGNLTYTRSETLGGSLFTLSIPTDNSLYKAEDYKQASAINPSTSADSHQPSPIILEMLPNALNDQHIAIIEDDPDMLEQIKTEVGVYFHVSGYTDGQSGIEGIRNDAPALLICDVMLPDTNGYDIVKTLKADEELKDIPVIMLTALEDERHQIKGYEAGADDYMVKPCNYRVLIARAIQLIKWKGERTERNTEETTHATIITTQADKRFKEKVNSIIAQHISDEDFSIDQMAEMMHMGRTKLYGKVKELTGMSPNKLLTAERMRIAAELLEEGELNISEIGYRVGISDASYFNKCFKQHFGMAPSKYKKEK